MTCRKALAAATTICTLVRAALTVDGLARPTTAEADLRPPPDAETSCGPIRDGDDRVLVWATRDEHTGLTYFLRRYDAAGHPTTDPVEVGWGYDGNAKCALAVSRHRIAVVFAFVDPYGGTPELWITIFERPARVVAHRKLLSSFCWELEPAAIAAAPDGGWVVELRCADRDDAPTERIEVDRDGYRRLDG